jgi:hypothetical protein
MFCPTVFGHVAPPGVEMFLCRLDGITCSVKLRLSKKRLFAEKKLTDKITGV